MNGPGQRPYQQGNWTQQWPGDPDPTVYPGVTPENFDVFNPPPAGFVGRNYPPQGDTPNSVDPGREFVQPLTLDQFWQMLGLQFSRQAVLLQRINTLTDLAQTKTWICKVQAQDVGSATLAGGITAPANAINIPDFRWASLICSRPGFGELTAGNVSKAYANPLLIVCDGQVMQAPQIGTAVLPVNQPKSLSVYSTISPAAMPVGWTLDLVLSTRPYEPRP